MLVLPSVLPLPVAPPTTHFPSKMWGCISHTIKGLQVDSMESDFLSFSLSTNPPYLDDLGPIHFLTPILNLLLCKMDIFLVPTLWVCCES